MMTDPIADMLTRIRNSLQIERPYVELPASKIKLGIAQTLQREGYVWDCEIVEQKPQNLLRLHLKYGPNGERVIQRIDRVSKPGRRVYSRLADLPEVLHGLGIQILSTNQGVLSDREAKQKGVSGEVLCRVW